MAVIRKWLTPLEIVPQNVRFNEEGDFQYSPDNGTTWIDSPEGDPRHGAVFRKPLPSMTDPACDAAARIVHLFQDNLEILFNSINAAQMATAWMSAFLFLTPAIGILVAVAILAFDALIEIGQANIEAAFTPTVWDDILCIIYCTIGDDGSVTLEERDAIMAKIADQHPGTVYNTMVNVVNLFGEVLMSNSSAEYDDTGDCGDCLCEWEELLDFQLSDWGFTDTIAYNGVWVSGAGWRTGGTASWDGFNNGYRIYQEKDLPFDTNITGFDVFIQPTTTHQMWVELYNNAYTTGGVAWTTTGTDATGHEETSPAFSGSMGQNVRHIRLFSSGFNPQNTFRYLRVRGTGTNPFA